MSFFKQIYRIVPVFEQGQQTSVLVQTKNQPIGLWRNVLRDCIVDEELQQEDAIFKTKEEAKNYIEEITNIITINK